MTKKQKDIWEVKGHEAMGNPDREEGEGLLDFDYPTKRYAEVAPGEKPICHGSVVKEHDRFSDNWHNGRGHFCPSCGADWCKCL